MGTSADTDATGVRPSRVVVLVDASPDALRALEVAVDLARRYGVKLLAVSVEEPDRARSAAFPFAREVGAVSGSIRRPGTFAQGQAGERGPASIRRAVERATAAAEVACEVVAVRGRLVEEVLALSRPGDFLMLGRVGWSARLGRRLGRAPLVLARRAGGTVQICSAAPERERGRTAVLVEDPAASDAMLRMAAARARAAGRDLVVLLAPQARDGGVDSLAKALEGGGPRWRMRPLSALSAGEMLRVLAEESAAELVAGREGGWLDTPAAARLLAHWRMPILVMPGPSG